MRNVNMLYSTPAILFYFLVARVLSALFLHIIDCDETYNYWEPLHYLVYGKGFQTWEYSPAFALRSYLYILLHATPAAIAKQLHLPKIWAFYSTRIVLAVGCATLEVKMYKSIRRFFGNSSANLWLIFQLFSPGMFISSTAFLPSSFSMYLTMAFLTSWWTKDIKSSIICIAISALLGWPFAALVSLPFLFDVLWKQKIIKLFVVWSLISTLLIGVPLMMVDSYYYGKLTLAPLNIITYNIFSSHGPNLYGIESKLFYVVNLFLNFNIVWCLTIVYPLLAIIGMVFLPSNKQTIVRNGIWKALPAYLWMIVFFLQPHKEERFLFPVFPLVTLCGSLSITTAQELFLLTKTMKIEKVSLKVIKASYILLSLSRIFALYRNYHAPMDISQMDFPAAYQNICIGKEWHRFPGNFFVAENNQIRFIRSHFKGILPAYFNESPDGTRLVHRYFNDQNRGNDYMLFDFRDCDYLIDFDNGEDFDSTDLEPNYSKQMESWIIEKSIPYLDAVNSNKIFRAFYVPYIGDKFVVFRNYSLLKRK